MLKMSGHIEDYEVLSVIGTGSFGTCYKVQKKSNGHLYVWKAVGYGGMSEEKKQV
jgi:NIMA (never in mitosis gene a)-related kinase